MGLARGRRRVWRGKLLPSSSGPALFLASMSPPGCPELLLTPLHGSSALHGDDDGGLLGPSAVADAADVFTRVSRRDLGDVQAGAEDLGGHEPGERDREGWGETGDGSPQARCAPALHGPETSTWDPLTSRIPVACRDGRGLLTLPWAAWGTRAPKATPPVPWAGSPTSPRPCGSPYLMPGWEGTSPLVPEDHGLRVPSHDAVQIQGLPYDHGRWRCRCLDADGGHSP